jgi:hypothetical protein
VHDAALVRRLERPAYLHGHVHGGRNPERSVVGDVVRDVATLQVLAHQVRMPVGRRVDVVDPHHVRVRHGRRGLGLAPETCHHVGVLRELLAQHLDRELLALDASVSRAIDTPHPAFAEHRLDDVGSVQRLADEIVVAVDRGRRRQLSSRGRVLHRSRSATLEGWKPLGHCQSQG